MVWSSKETPLWFHINLERRFWVSSMLAILASKEPSGVRATLSSGPELLMILSKWSRPVQPVKNTRLHKQESHWSTKKKLQVHGKRSEQTYSPTRTKNTSSSLTTTPISHSSSKWILQAQPRSSTKWRKFFPSKESPTHWSPTADHNLHQINFNLL